MNGVIIQAGGSDRRQREMEKARNVGIHSLSLTHPPCHHPTMDDSIGRCKLRTPPSLPPLSYARHSVTAKEKLDQHRSTCVQRLEEMVPRASVAEKSYVKTSHNTTTKTDADSKNLTMSQNKAQNCGQRSTIPQGHAHNDEHQARNQ